MRRKRTWVYEIDSHNGKFRATIDNSRPSSLGGEIPPTLRIVRSTGPGLFDWSDWHFTQAKHVKTLKSRLAHLIGTDDLEKYRVE